VSLAVQSFKGLDRLELADLAQDLNLVVGPNESGKSRLALALRYALFERYKGESEDKKALRSHGSSESPVVEVRFEAGGTVWTVKKQFLRQAFAKLEGGGRTWTDDDAEAKLRELLGTKPIQGRREVDQFLGLWPLLWVRQGEAWNAPQSHMNDDARARLRDVLATQVNEVAAGPLGERLVARAETERDRFFTTTGKETGELAAARSRHLVAEATLAEALAKREDARESADELATLRRELGDIDQRIGAQRVLVARAEARAARVKEIAARVRSHETEVARKKAESELAQRSLDQHRELAERAAEIDRRGAEEEASKKGAAAALGELASRQGEVAARAQAASQGLEAARAQDLRARRRAHLDEAARREREAAERLARAKSHEARVAELRAGLADARIDEAQIQRLRRAGEAAAKTGAALQAAAAWMKMKAARDVVIDGERLAEGEERAWTFDGPRTLVIEGVGILEVRPGGADLDARRTKDHDARHALASELERLAVRSVAEAEERFARRTGLVAQLAQAEPLLAEAAPNGVAALEQDVQTRAAERAAFGEIDAEVPSIDDADKRLRAATELADRTRAEGEALRAEVTRATEAERRHELAIAELGRERAVLTARLEALATESALAESAAAARAALVDALKTSDALSGELAQATGDGADLALEQESRVLARLENDRTTKQARTVTLEAFVEVHGGEELHERVQEAEATAEDRRETLRATEARAAAAKDLVTALHAARRQVQERLVAPVVERARPYLETLLPGRRLRMDENWSVLGLGTGDVEEEFEGLSGGAKEQVSILVRLALAEVLGEKDPLPLVLDDCLVNTDRARLGEMLRILYRAARKQQIILFSCHDLAFERLGETRRYELLPRAERASR
jgi:energy-coupling factor transporter ATP-binding protein EcfA2